jgi:hypothetical protein
MIDITITATHLSYQDSVIGSIDTDYNREETEMVDAVSMHFVTDRGILLINVLQYKFNGNSFGNTTEAITYLQTL